MDDEVRVSSDRAGEVGVIEFCQAIVSQRIRAVGGALETFEQGDFQGVVATDLSLQRLNEFVRKLSLSSNAVAFIVEPDGNLIASSRSPNIAVKPDGSSARISAVDSDNALQRAAYARVKA